MFAEPEILFDNVFEPGLLLVFTQIFKKSKVSHLLAITQSSKSQATKTLITGLIQSVFFLKTHSHFVLMKSFF